jgi:quinolinate synthase
MINLKMLTDKEVDDRILDMKGKFRDELFIPVHHYQRDEIVQFADYTGDSLELSRVSAGTEAKYIIFCGVYFMAEIARTLVAKDKHVLIPNRSAGCPLADLAFYEDVEFVWEILQENHPGDYIPVTYANSHADVKAFCGRNGGLVCTSSNVQKIFQWILDRKKRIFFMPDKNLGLNTAVELGLEGVASVVDRYNQDSLYAKDSKIVIWNGFCIVHKVFRLGHVSYWRSKDKDIKIIVHPECDPEVVKASDYSGSTSKIKKMVEQSSKNAKWVIGTEFNLVNRLKLNNPDKFIEPLTKSVCANMSKNTRRDLLATLLSIEGGDFGRQVVLSDRVVNEGKQAIEKMLEIS